MRGVPSPITAIGVVLILVGGLASEEGVSGVCALLALLILAVVTYPPADPRRGHQAVMILASAAGLLALGLLLEEIRQGPVVAQAVEDFLVLVGSVLVFLDSQARLLESRARAAPAWGGRGEGTQPARPMSRN